MTKIRDLLAAGRTYSLEFFPPKTEEMERQLEKAVAELAPLGPSFVSVTYGALGSTRETTKGIVIRMNVEQPFPAMPHLTCVAHTRDDIKALLDEYAEAGIENILALGGDPPADGSDPGGDFEHAIELVELVRDHAADFSIGVAAHPELHPRSNGDRERDRQHLAAKLSLADFGITQFFSAEHHLRMVDELAAVGCDTPVIPSLMPLISVAGVRRMAAMNGTEIPPALEARLDEVADDARAVIDLGVEVAADLGHRLLDAGVPGLHMYALNRSESVTRLWSLLDLPRGVRR